MFAGVRGRNRGRNKTKRKKQLRMTVVTRESPIGLVRMTVPRSVITGPKRRKPRPGQDRPQRPVPLDLFSLDGRSE